MNDLVLIILFMAAAFAAGFAVGFEFGRREGWKEIRDKEVEWDKNFGWKKGSNR